VNKGLGYMFLFINVFTVFSEIDAGLQGRSMKKALGDCPVILAGIAEMAKKGVAISKGIKSKEDLKVLAKKTAKDAKKQIIVKGKERARKEIDEIKVDAKAKQQRMDEEVERRVEEQLAEKTPSEIEATEETLDARRKNAVVVRVFNNIMAKDFDEMLEQIAEQHDISDDILKQYKNEMQDYVIDKGANTPNLIRVEMENFSEMIPLSDAAPAAG